MKKQTDAQRLRAMLERAHLSQRGAAKLLGISERAMRYYVAGEQEVPQLLLLALESLSGDPAFFQRVEHRIRQEAGCKCYGFKIATYLSREPGSQEVLAGYSVGNCEACAAGLTEEAAKRVLRLSGVPLIGTPRVPAKHK
jgi:hypothetical protein